MSATREIERIGDQLRRAMEGPAWNGPALLPTLKGVTAEQAAARPLPGAHSVGELVGHIRVWQNVARRRLDGVIFEPNDTENFPPLPPDPAAWQTACDALRTSYHALLARILSTPDADLHRIVPDRDYDVYTLLHGVVQHNLYHTGQIVLLTRYG